MSYYICKVEPEFKDWQFKGVNESIPEDQFKNLKTTFENLVPEENDRYNLYSIQNQEYSMHLWHSERYNNCITVTRFPDRHKGEFVKYLYQICGQLNSKLYCLGNDGQSAVEFDFTEFKEDIEKEYKPRDEKQYSKVQVDELIGLITIYSPKKKVIESLNLIIDKVDTWENSINECYTSKSIVVRQIENWTILIAKPENLVQANTAEEQNKLMNELLKELSLELGLVGYNFNASKYSYFENCQFRDGKQTYKYIHGDGEEEILGEKSKEYFEDFLSLTFDESITKGVETYKIPSR